MLFKLATAFSGSCRIATKREPLTFTLRFGRRNPTPHPLLAVQIPFGRLVGRDKDFRLLKSLLVDHFKVVRSHSQTIFGLSLTVVEHVNVELSSRPMP